MSFRLVRAAVVSSLVLGLAASPHAVADPPTSAASVPDPGSSPSYTDTAARSFADGGPASQVPVDALSVATASDGSVLFYDQLARQLRRADMSTKTISVVAGNGQESRTGVPDTSGPASSTALPPIDELTVSASGDVFGRVCGGSFCQRAHDVYELDVTADRWHLVVKHSFTGDFDYAGFAVTPAGDVLVTDIRADVVRRFVPGADPDGRGQVVTGLGPGLDGPIAVAPHGDVFAAVGTDVQRLATDGTVTTLVDPSADRHKALQGLTLSRDGANVYVLLASDPSMLTVRAVPVDGSTPHTVAGPLPTCGSDSEVCLNRQLTEVTEDGVTAVAAAESGAILSWPADGSDPLVYHRLAGILNDSKGMRSPDGTPLKNAFLTAVDTAAVGPGGAVAIATRSGVKTFPSLDPDATLHTALDGPRVTWLHYADDGTLYALAPEPAPHVVAVASDGTVTTVLGGGADVVDEGVAPGDIALTDSAQLAVDPADGSLYFADHHADDRDATIWRLGHGADAVHAFGSVKQYASDPGSLTVASDGSVLTGAAGVIIRIGTDGTTGTLTCSSACPTAGLGTLADGRIFGRTDGRPVFRDADGDLHVYGATGFYSLTVTPDGRLLGLGQHGLPGGLLALTVPLAAASSALAPPAVVLTNHGRTVELGLTRPSGADVDRVIVCHTVDGVQDTDYVGCADTVESSYDTDTLTLTQPIDPLVSTRFWAFSVDRSGNRSAPVSVVRPAAHLVAGQAVQGVVYGSRDNDIDLSWTDGNSFAARTVTGGAAPAAPALGDDMPLTVSGTAARASVAVFSSLQVGVSIFGWADDGLTTYRRTSFVATVATDVDSVSVSASPVVIAGRRPVVSATVVRRSPSDGASPVGATSVTLFRRAAATAPWVLTSPGVTNGKGVVGFTVPVPTSATEYQARFRPVHSTGLTTSSAVARTGVTQVLTLAAPSRGRVHQAVAVSGILAPARVSVVVTLQQYVNRRWVTVQSVRTTRAGAYRCVFRPSRTGRWTLRTVVAATPTLGATVSPVRVIAVG